ncbi:hypothetical protein YH66_02020 [[Brevibacterium] flavum]|uniref:Asparagine synthetase domain-containing protein n=1 Tax=[Brevibacterium] flavum TaxID=92706 RepID=A0A0F6SQL4_9CORY|nr:MULTISPECIES: hypothetical protein [Corynebacterium]AKF26414.1 hypothetical protein YH66_02020 [[Brevibacterium] flavum]ANE07239.1 hypothetical protein A3654_02000 [Corynebacterium glutamicum]AST19648.1 hypothetical protein CEY17_02030 [Corynebacterium glutamicum ATCC 14067]KEI22102.1 hypothetical protein KIQ_005810 [Corynebacterium glutamicum ATCC 14067]OKX90119.1 hypothetical protein AUP71_14625 [Corynebacterium glutamicum]
MFLISIPKPHAEAGPCNVESREALNRVLHEYKALVQLSKFKDEVFISEDGKSPSFFVLKKERDTDPVSFLGSNWCVTAGVCDSAALVKSLTHRAGRLYYNEPVWGSYAAVFAEQSESRVSAWNTIPGTETVYYGQNQKAVFISNRPLLVSLALSDGVRDAVQLSKDFLAEYLLYGYSVTDRTPYIGVNILSSNKRLEVRHGILKILDFPLGLEISLPEQMSVQDKAARLALAMRNALDRCSAHLNDRSLQIRVSGGKDSRAILGLARNLDNSVYAVTFGQSQDLEVKMSNYLTKLSEFDLEVKTAPKNLGDGLRNQVEISLSTSDGIPLSEPHGSIYLGSNSKEFGDGIMLGQWPLMKGGAATRFSYTMDKVEEIILGQGAPIVDSRERQQFDQFFQNWIKDKNVSDNSELLYLFSRDFRSARWMLALTTQYDRDATVVYPLADAEVAAVSDALLMKEKVSQQVYFLAINEIWPESLSSPCVGSAWPFEAKKMQKGYRENDYEARHLSPLEFFERQEQDYAVAVPVAKTTEFLRATGTEMAQAIISSPLKNVFQGVLTKDFWEMLVEWSTGKHSIHLETSMRITIQWIWRVFVADVWFQRNWLLG